MQSEGSSEAPPISKLRLLATLLLAAAALGCLKETRRVDVPPPAVVREASLEDLTGIIERFEQIESLKATVDLQLTYLNDQRTKETQYMDVRGAIVAQRPGAIRVQALLPVTRQRALDMVSRAGMFRVYLPWQNRFFEGSTDVEKRSEKRSENIRPQHVLEPLLIEPIKEDNVLVLDVLREGRTPFYVVQEIVPGQGRYRIARKFWFNRTDLTLSRLEIRNEAGELATTARYSEWVDFGEKMFPTTATIDRPVDGYTLKVTFLKPGIDEEPTENAFDLQPPDGVEVERIEDVEDAVAKRSGTE